MDFLLWGVFVIGAAGLAPLLRNRTAISGRQWAVAWAGIAVYAVVLPVAAFVFALGASLCTGAGLVTNAVAFFTPWVVALVVWSALGWFVLRAPRPAMAMWVVSVVPIGLAAAGVVYALAGMMSSPSECISLS